MYVANMIIKRALSTQANDIGRIFIQENIQKLLKDISRFEQRKIFARRVVSKLESPKLMFLTDEELEKAKQDAYDHAKARIQMPPVMPPDTSEPEILARDKDIVGYSKFKIMFIDISHGSSNRNRLMSVRETDGTLREPTHIERSRLNHMFYPHKERPIDTPKMFEDPYLSNLLKRKQYLFVLNRACIQFEPDDPRYVDVTSKVYLYIDDKGDYDKLRSTRHFGPMSLFLAYNKRADDLVIEMLSKNLIEDAAKLVKIYNTCHNLEFEDNEDHLATIKHYAENHSAKKYNLDLALQEKLNNPS